MDPSSLIYPMFVKEGDVAARGDPDDAGPVPLHVSIVHRSVSSMHCLLQA